MMETVLGPIPKSMAQASKGLHNCFTGRDFRLNWPGDASKRSIRYALIVVVVVLVLMVIVLVSKATLWLPAV